MKLVHLIYKETKKFPAEEKFGLSSQIRRAAISIGLNIAKGAGRKTKKDFANFTRNAIGSTLEVIACLRIAEQEKFINNYLEIEEIIRELYFKLIGLEKFLKKVVNNCSRCSNCSKCTNRTNKRSEQLNNYNNFNIPHGRLAQLVEHLVYTEEVGGSSPSAPTIYEILIK